jgi:hypothetical protein
MKYKYIFLGVACVGLLTYCLGMLDLIRASTNSAIEVKVRVHKDTYLVGEIVPITIEVQNTGAKIEEIFGNLPPAEIYVSQKDTNNYRECTNTIRKKDDAKRNSLKLLPNEQVTVSESILWNSDKNSNESVRPWKPGRVSSDYVFPIAGTYYVKVRYRIYLTTTPLWIESEPIKITIGEPVEEELGVWNRIKNNGDFAYFIQEGDMRIPSYKLEDRAKFQMEIEQILIDYPNSFYATSLRQSLDKFRANEAKRQEFLEKVQKQKSQ